MYRGIIAAIAALSVFAITLGISFPLFSLMLERAGFSETMIGLNSAMAPLGILVCSLFLPRIAARVDAVTLAVGGAAMTALLFLVFAAVSEPLLWFPIRFLLGVSINVLWVLSESWINQLAPDHLRGRVMGVYATVLSTGFMIGPSIIWLIGTEGLTPFLVGSLFAVLAIPVLLSARSHLTSFADTGSSSLAGFSRRAPLLVGVAFAVALFDQTTLSLLPVYGLRMGMDERTAALAVSVLVAGNIVVQFPIGWLADLMPRRTLALVLATTTTVGALLLLLAGGGPLIWLALILWGAVGFGTYTVALAELGSRFSGTMLVAGNATFALMWGVGGIAGPTLTGTAMDAIGPDALPVVMGLVFVVLTLAILRWPLVRVGETSSRPASQAAR